MQFEKAYGIYREYWFSPFRFYHTDENHLSNILPLCDSIELKYFALFHDIVYDSRESDIKNVDESIEFFKRHMDEFDDLPHDAKELVIEMIEATKDHKTTHNNPMVNKAIEIDLSILDSSMDKLIEYEELIFKEYQRTDINEYVKKRIKFLELYKERGNIKQLIEYLKEKKYSIGLYAGSFDPFHVGHLDILEKAEKLFDKVIIVRAINPSKAKHKFKMPSTLPNQMIFHDGLITELFKEDGHKYTLVRGIRNEYDIASEMNYMSWVNEIKKDVPFVHLFCDPKHIKISSSALKNMSQFESFNLDQWVVF